ncbi:MAG TPA: DUF1102 domain-containing protein [Candidatus Thermoplasmatota archaeon]|nr:DUF1102 domain-containing protein [Candidatus Thermoplasmatota archaeon]
MFARTTPGWAMLIGAAALSVALVTAFTDGSTGARTVTASVVTDTNSYLAIEENANSPHDGFLTEAASGKLTIAFDANNLDAAGDGINPDGAYEFDAIVKITNKGTATRSVDITIGGTDSSLCTVALTAAEDQSAETYTSNPAPVSVAVAANAYLGVKVAGTSKTAGESVACTITVTGA